MWQTTTLIWHTGILMWQTMNLIWQIQIWNDYERIWPENGVVITPMSVALILNHWYAYQVRHYTICKSILSFITSNSKYFKSKWYIVKSSLQHIRSNLYYISSKCSILHQIPNTSNQIHIAWSLTGWVKPQWHWTCWTITKVLKGGISVCQHECLKLVQVWHKWPTGSELWQIADEGITAKLDAMVTTCCIKSLPTTLACCSATTHLNCTTGYN
jgi:hypothetical protein